MANLSCRLAIGLFFFCLGEGSDCLVGQYFLAGGGRVSRDFFVRRMTRHGFDLIDGLSFFRHPPGHCLSDSMG